MLVSIEDRLIVYCVCVCTRVCVCVCTRVCYVCVCACVCMWLFLYYDQHNYVVAMIIVFICFVSYLVVLHTLTVALGL